MVYGYDLVHFKDMILNNVKVRDFVPPMSIARISVLTN